jgi:predicted transcriptional regulator
MASNTHDPAELGELERDLLSIVWRLGTVTAEQAREELNRPLKDSTIRTVLRRLEEKGYLAHSVDWFCEGSVEELLVGMVDSKVLDQAELQRLATRIFEAQKRAGSQITPVEMKKEAKQ